MHELQELLGVRSPPIGIAFRDAAPAEVAHRASAPASCAYWRAAAEGEVFYTDARDHEGCPIGAHTHGVELTPEKQRELMGLVETMVGLQYLKMEEVPQIPHRTEPLRVAVYAPLEKMPCAADLALVRGTARQLMLLAEAAQMAGAAGDTPMMGRPTCAALPQALGSGRTAASFGCIGNRVYTGLPDDEAWVAIPLRHLPAIVERLRAVIHANAEAREVPPRPRLTCRSIRDVLDSASPGGTMHLRLCPVLVLAACSADPSFTPAPARSTSLATSGVVDVSNDQTAQNETPVAVNPTNAANLITGANDWNYNDGCAVNASFDGGKTWTATLPNGFLPGVTRFTNDPNVPGTGAYDAGGDPAIAFGPDGTAYYVCQAFNFTPPHQIAMLVSRSTDGGRTWLDGRTQPLTQVTNWNGSGKSKGSNGQFPDHESIYVDNGAQSPYRGRVYVTWVQFDGQTHSPVYVAWSSDGARTFSAPVAVTASTIRNNQDARLTSAPDGTLFLTFDNGVQGGKGTVLYVAKSTDGGATWTQPAQFAALVNPVCTFPPSCFNISGTPFRSGGSYPAPAYDPVRGRLVVIWPDIAGAYGQVYVSSTSDLATWTAPQAIAPAPGDQFQSELAIAADGSYSVSFYDRSYSGNALVDVTYARSTDGGQSWRTTRVTPAGFDPGAWGVPSGAGFRPFIGDYNGIAALPGGGAVLTWTGVAPPQPYNLEIDFASVGK